MKTKRKTHSELDHLRGKVRELEKEVRTLTKQLKYYKKHEHTLEKTIDEDEEETIMKKGIPCDCCGKGTLVEFTVMDKVFGTCDICGERKKLK